MPTAKSDGQKKLEGLVAQVINARELVINIGANDGVEKGMRFAVLAKSPTTVTDPESGEQLGVIDREKVRVEAGEVTERMTICRTYLSEYVGGGLLFPFGAWAEVAGPRREQVETLKATAKSYPEPLSEKESYVKRGDRVVQVTD